MQGEIIQKPSIRPSWRRRLGREYYILRRKRNDKINRPRWAKPRCNEYKHEILKHRSVILRPLKDVEMYLQENKRTNLRIAISHLNGLSIAPGETFSVWKFVGRPTAVKGYLEGLVLHQGQITKGIGGGLCQLGNLLFWLFAHSPLRIVERHRHSFDVFPDISRTVPFGSGATLSYNYIDLRVYNPTDNTFYIDLWLDDVYLNGCISSQYPLRESYSIQECDHFITMQPWGGYTRHNKLYRRIIQPDGAERTDLLVQNFAIMMYNPLLNPPL